MHEHEQLLIRVQGYNNLSIKSKNPPILQSGDLVYVNQSFSSKFYDFMRFLGVVGAVSYYLIRVAD